MGNTRNSEAGLVAQKLKSIYLEAVKEAGSTGIPNGHLYAITMGFGISLEIHNAVIMALKQNGMITESHNLLKAA